MQFFNTSLTVNCSREINTVISLDDSCTSMSNDAFQNSIVKVLRECNPSGDRDLDSQEREFGCCQCHETVHRVKVGLSVGQVYIQRN